MAETGGDRNLSGGGAPIDVVLVGAGERARAWLSPLQRSTRLRLIATVVRGDEAIAADLPCHQSLDDALRQHPNAGFAVALPPRAGLEAALHLAESGRIGVVEAPLHDALCDIDLGGGAAGVRVAHGWATLAAVPRVRALLQRMGSGRLRLDVAGLPEEDRGDLRECLVHAAALVRALLPEASVIAARRVGAHGLEVDLTAVSPAGGWDVQLCLHTRGQRVGVRAEGAGETALWSWERDRESMSLGGKPLPMPRLTPPAQVRALAQLLPDTARGDGLKEAAEVLCLVRSCLLHLPTQLPLGARALRQSASIARRRPSDLLARLGLRGDVPAAGAVAPVALALAMPSEPFELWAFRAGIKPVVFLTVRPQDVERTLAFFGAVAYERRDRLVQIETQDRWLDRRDQGEPRVELYIAHDAELARRAAHLQAEVDPTQAIRELGALVGYPSCCTEAFAEQEDRANNSGNRYHSRARTVAADGSGEVPWSWELNNLHTMIIPFYPCSYRCEQALAWARAALAELSGAHADFAEQLRTTLARPTLYFDHDHQLVFDGEYDEGVVAYRAVTLARAASLHFVEMAAAIGSGNRLSFDDEKLLVERDGQVVLQLERTDPGLGFIAPFGVGPS